MERDSHVAVQSLLPWYVRGQLGDDEMHEVQAHLQQCAVCRAELEGERAMQPLLSLLTAEPPSSDVDKGLAKMRARIKNKVSSATAPARVPRWLGWTLGLQGGAIAALLVVLILPRLDEPTYKGLSAQAPSLGAEALIMFRGDASEQRIRELLQAHGASIIGGPTETGAYLLRLGKDEQALARLRADPVVTLVESLEPGARR
jgi:anti-sigma factor RsiW